MARKRGDVKNVEKKLSTAMKSTSWQRNLKKSDGQLRQLLEKLRQDSRVDPRLLDEPATL